MTKRHMKPGAIVEVPGRGKATVVYHHLDGFGIVWGEQDVDPADLPEPEAMLREEYPGADLPCVGTNYSLVRDGSFEPGEKGDEG